MTERSEAMNSAIGTVDAYDHGCGTTRYELTFWSGRRIDVYVCMHGDRDTPALVETVHDNITISHRVTTSLDALRMVWRMAELAAN